MMPSKTTAGPYPQTTEFWILGLIESIGQENKTVVFPLQVKDPVLYELCEPCMPGQLKVEQKVDASSQSEEESLVVKEKTTVMLRNLPNNYTRDMFLELLDENGFKCQYNFVYLPFDWCRDANLGYAFVNMVNSKAVDRLRSTFQDFSDWSIPSVKVCQVRWSHPHQGLKAHIERYRNSPLMHKSVPEHFKPMIFENGVPQPFPKPKNSIKPPFPF